MKKVILTIIVISAIFACKKDVINISEGPSLRVENEIKDITVDEGIVAFQINISNVFKLYSTDRGVIIKSIYANQNTALVDAQIMGDTLYLDIDIGQIGSSEITIRGEFGDQVEYESFVFTVNEISANAALSTAVSSFQNGDYEAAETFFRVLISKNNTQFTSDAYMGLGYSQMRNNNAPDAYLSLQSSISANTSNNDSKAGLSLLEYSYTNNYTEAIRYTNEVLASSSNYIFKYDSNLDYHDLMVNKALSQYASQLFDECLITIQQLDPSFTLLSNDPEYKTKLYQKLQALVLLYG